MFKKVISVILSVIIAASVLTIGVGAVSGDERVLNIRIVISKNANFLERAAAEFLRDTVRESTNIEYPIITDSEGKKGFEIAVGKTRRFDYDVSSFADGGYVIKSYDGGIAVVGAGNRGNIYGVCRLLKEFGGYRCFVAGDKLANGGDALNIPNDVDIEYTPYFEYTETDWRLSWCDSHIYSLSNGLSGGVYNRISEDLGGTVNYINSFAHTLTAGFCSKDKYFDSHPEYFALRDGKRIPTQLCLTNEYVYHIVLDEVLDLLKNRYDPEAALQIISLTQADNQDYCQCENCKRLDEENESHAGTMISFVNRIAEQVALMDYDNVAIDTFAYQYTRKPPKNVKPLDNVIVRLCSIECCFTHTFDDPDCERNTKFMSDLYGWGKICDRVYVWDYANNYKYTVCIFPDFGVLQRNMQILCENNVKGVYVEGNYYLGKCDAEFGDLRSYLIASLLSDPYCDYDKAMREFCDFYYGAAGKEIVEFINKTSENAKKGHVRCFNSVDKTLHFSRKEVKECDELWENAKRNTAHDEVANEHVRRSEISWRVWKSSVRKGEFEFFGLFPERMRLYRDICDFGIEKFCEWDDLEMKLPLHLILSSPNEWKSDVKATSRDYGNLIDVCIRTYDTIRALVGRLFGKWVEPIV